MTELLRRAAALVPDHARSDAGFTSADVEEYLEQDDWNAALEVLGDFGGIGWQTTDFWELLAGAAEELFLDSRWFRWRASETRQGIVVRAEFHGAKEKLLAGNGQFRPLWDLGKDRGVWVGAMWVEAKPKLDVRLLPLSPEAWRLLEPGDVVTALEGQRVAGTATIVETAVKNHE